MDNFLNNNDYEKIGDMSKIKKTLKSCMDMDKFIDKTKEVIDNSEHFEFRSNRTRKFIDKKDPTYILSYKGEDMQTLDKTNPLKVNALTNKITELIRKEIVMSISTYLTDCITDKEKFDSLFKDLPEEFSETLLTNIYIVRLSLNDNSVILKYFL